MSTSEAAAGVSISRSFNLGALDAGSTAKIHVEKTGDALVDAINALTPAEIARCGTVADWECRPIDGGPLTEAQMAYLKYFRFEIPLKTTGRFLTYPELAELRTRDAVEYELEAQKVSGALGVSFGAVKTEVDKAAADPSLYPSKNAATVQPPPALALQPNILKDFAVAVGGCGVVGEIAIAQTLYLVLTARLLDKPVSAAIKGLSSSGKSYTTEQTVGFFPPEAVVSMTGMSEHAIIYRKEDYRHKVLILYEADALNEGKEGNQTAYFVRTLLSEGRINYDVTVRDPNGGFTTKSIIKEGPTGLILTTTKTNLHPENETRMISLNTNDTPQQTKSILRSLAGGSKYAPQIDEWIALQRWLQTAERRVIIPYAPDLAEMIPPVAVRLRRDFSLVLSLIKAHAILHQATRKRDKYGRIVASIDDYAAVHKLVAGVISEGVGATAQETVRETVAIVDELGGHDGVAALAIAAKLKLDKGTVSRRLSAAAGKGYIRNLEDKRGRPGRWVTGDPMPDKVVILPQPQPLATALCNRLAQEQHGGCTVADEIQGVNIPEREPGCDDDLGDCPF